MTTRNKPFQIATGVPTQGYVPKVVGDDVAWQPESGGATGPQGPTGPAGPTGPIGPTGPAGGGSTEEVFISPTLTATGIDDYSPSGWSDATVVRLSVATGIDPRITGFDSNVTVTRKTVIGVTDNGQITYLLNQATGSTGPNRIITSPGAGFAISEDDAVQILYDSISNRWRTV